MSLGVRIDSKFNKKKLFLPEDVLVSASIEGIEGKYRTLSLVVSWCFYHFLHFIEGDDDLFISKKGVDKDFLERILNCSLNASYRNWRDIAEARGLGII
ncbi:MAG: hypothetical protein HQK49_15145 [Oligoflexia bacterium]|nr:hypothetical protein [Oligoflexia bacterium]